MNEMMLVVLAYLLGSIPTSIWVSKAIFGIDIRHYGSGNPGATNTFRVLGSKWGTFVMIADITKGVIATSLYILIPFYLQNELARTNFMIVLGLAAVLGHIFPIWADFKGGKGVATILGMALAIQPIVALICIIVFLITLFTTRFVSLSSMLASVVFMVLILFIFKEKETSYRWDFGRDLKVSGLKLINYSLPNIKYNIDEHNNYLIINNKKIVIENGFYDINQLLNEINSKQSQFKLSVKPSCKIEIEPSEENINITKSQLLNNVLGFSDDVKLTETIIGNNVYDLRIDNKIYMYITNLSDNPFGILYSNSQVPCQFSFKEPFNLNCLDICFRNSSGNNVNFHNLKHNLGFIILTHS